MEMAASDVFDWRHDHAITSHEWMLLPIISREGADCRCDSSFELQRPDGHPPDDEINANPIKVYEAE